jgi:hypothetical protein
MENNLLHRRAGLIIVKIDRTASEQTARLSAELVRHGPLTVLDGGNCFPFYRIARLLRAPVNESAAAIGRLYIHRAFTCYQMLALLESTPALHQLYLVLDLLGTFYDEQIPEWDVSHLLDACIGQVKRLCLHAPVTLLLFPPLLPERAHLYERVCQQADQVFGFSEPLPGPVQPTLF